MFNRRFWLWVTVVTGLMLAACGPARPSGKLTGAQIESTIVGNTLTGKIAGGDYTEYYEKGGVIKGKDYTGNWTIEGDTFCVAYDGQAQACYGIELNGDSLKWLNADGSAAGDGTLKKGNANNY